MRKTLAWNRWNEQSPNPGFKAGPKLPGSLTQLLDESIYPYSKIDMYGYVDVELRVLSYEIIEDKTGLDVLDLIQK